MAENWSFHIIFSKHDESSLITKINIEIASVEFVPTLGMDFLECFCMDSNEANSYRSCFICSSTFIDQFLPIEHILRYIINQMIYVCACFFLCIKILKSKLQGFFYIST